MTLHRVSDPRVRLVAGLDLIGEEELALVLYALASVPAMAIGRILSEALIAFARL